LSSGALWSAPGRLLRRADARPLDYPDKPGNDGESEETEREILLDLEWLVRSGARPECLRPPKFHPLARFKLVFTLTP
jgi:hypothetical protein